MGNRLIAGIKSLGTLLLLPLISFAGSTRPAPGDWFMSTGRNNDARSPDLWRPEIRVGLFQKELPDHFWVSSSAGLRLFHSTTGKSILNVPGKRQVALEKVGTKVRLMLMQSPSPLVGEGGGGGVVGEWDAVRIEPVQESDFLIMGTERIEKRPFHGTLEVQARARELLSINIVSENDYLNAVVADEMPSAWPREALKTQAVVARTYMQKNRGRHRADGYDFCDLAHCQAYQGASKGNSAVRDAVKETDHEALAYQGALVESFFHSSCGGHTASNEDVWQGPARPYLRGRPDSDGAEDFCQRSPDYRWTVTMKKQDLDAMLRPVFETPLDPGTLQSLEIKSSDPSGRAKEIQIRFSKGSATISGYKFYLLWGRRSRWHQLKSTWFQISSWGDAFEFRGRGLGHGIGLCQWGAYGRAAKGFNYRDILAYYFPGIQIENRY